MTADREGHTTCEFSDIHGLKMRDIFENIETNKLERVELLADRLPIPDEESPDLCYLILLKEKFNINDSAYKELRQLYPAVPTFYQLSCSSASIICAKN